MIRRLKEIRRLSALRAKTNSLALRQHILTKNTKAQRVINAGKPLILISQIQRSGGTLLSQLFDGHPEVFAHPAEINVGYPKKWDWLVNVKGADDWFLFEKLCHPKLMKLGMAKTYWKEREDTLPFEFSVKTYRNTLVQQTRIDGSPQGLFRACMTAVFTAWLNYHHREEEMLSKKRFVSGFVPRLIMFERSVESLFETCPDVRILTVIRDPRSWYASAKAHSPSYRKLGEAMDLWSASANASLDLAYSRPDVCKQIFFRDLVTDSEVTMKSISDFVGLSWDDSLRFPTFNGLHIASNSRFESTRGVINADAVDRWKRYLDLDEINFIEQYVRNRTGLAELLSP